MSYTGLCTYPLGGYLSLALIVSTCAAFASTIYGSASCRFVAITFTSTAGDLENYFSKGRSDVSSTPMQYKTSLGLFQWLRPINPETDWSEGSCVGYQESMLDRVSDTNFEVARTFAVFAILLSVVEILWVFFGACFEMNRIQGILFCVVSGFGTIATCLTFMYHQSYFCTTAFDARECSMDEGGLVMIGAAVLWLISFCISTFFAYPVVAKANAIDFAKEDARDKKKLTKDIARNRKKQNSKSTKSLSPNLAQSYSFDSQQDWNTPIPKRSNSRVASVTVPRQPPYSNRQGATRTSLQTPSPITVDDVSQKDAMEVYIAKRLDRIQQLAEV